MRSGWQIVWLLLLSGANYAQSVLPLDTSFGGVVVEKPFLYQLRQPPAGLKFPKALSAFSEQWQSVKSINYGRRSFVGWARFSVRSEQSRPVWLELTSHFMDSVGVWIALPNGPPQRIRGPSSYREQATSAAPVNHNYFLYALNLPARQTVTVWIQSRVVTGDALKFHVRLWDPRRFLVVQQRELWGWATFAGIILAILGGVLISFLFYQRTIYLLYACYVLCLSVYALLNDGWGAFLPDSLVWFDNLITVVHWINVGFGAFVMFSRRFLAVSPKPGRLLIKWPEVVPIGILAGSLLVAEWAQQRNYDEVIRAMYFTGYVGCWGYLLIWLTYVVDAFRRRYELVWLLLLAVSTLLVFLFINAFLINFNLIDSVLPDMMAFRLALLIELAILSIGWLYRRKLLQNARQQLEIQNRSLQTDVIQTQESERQRIAADLHDDLGGTLATLRRRLTDLRQYLHEPEGLGAFDALQPLIQKSSADLRRIAHNLMPPEFARIGLRSALQQLVHTQPSQPTRFSFITSGNEQKLPIDTELNAYRIVSELVQNIGKHAQANRAALQLLYHTDHLTITVEDDGLGSRAVALMHEPMGIGLKNSNLRAEYIGATLWRDVSEGGTLVVLTIPYPAPVYAAPSTQPNPPD
ncbi:sensor histidine kinase [Spirosoma arcticum]